MSQEFLDSNYKNTDFKKIVNFLKQNPKWPQNALLKTRAEGLINENFDKTEIYHWFSKNPPITGCGYKYYALAASQILTDVNQLTPIIKDGWIYGSFNKDEQIDFYRRFKKFLSKDDIIKRVDNLIWKGSTTLAKILFNLVDAGYTKAFEAQIAFSDNKKDAKKLFRTVPKEYYTSTTPPIDTKICTSNILNHNEFANISIKLPFYPINDINISYLPPSVTTIFVKNVYEFRCIFDLIFATFDFR